VVINTPGWISGAGLDTLVAAHAALGPKTVLFLQDAATTAVELPFPGVSALLSVASGAMTEAMSAGQLRDWSVTRCVSGHRFVVPLSRVCVVIHGGGSVVEHLVLAAVLETVVALVVSESFRGREGYFCSHLPSDGVLVCMGFVRGFEDGSFVIESSCESASDANVVVRAMHDAPSREAKSKRMGINKTHYASLPMTGSKYILRNKDF
jgi:hypothetical protein